MMMMGEWMGRWYLYFDSEHLQKLILLIYKEVFELTPYILVLSVYLPKC